MKKNLEDFGSNHKMRVSVRLEEPMPYGLVVTEITEVFDKPLDAGEKIAWVTGASKLFKDLLFDKIKEPELKGEETGFTSIHGLIAKGIGDKVYSKEEFAELGKLSRVYAPGEDRKIVLENIPKADLESFINSHDLWDRLKKK